MTDPDEAPAASEPPIWLRDPWSYSGWDGHPFERDEKVCGKCEYWLRYEGSIEGDCRRHAPRATSPFDEANLQVRIWRAEASEQMETTEVARAVFWPSTTNYDFCGEFRDRIGLPRHLPR